MSASPSIESKPTYYYDIQTIILANGADLSTIFPSAHPSAPPPLAPTIAIPTPTGGSRVPVPPPATPKSEPVPDVKQEDSEEDLEVFTYPAGDPVVNNPMFCPSCGVRVSKHKVKKGKKSKGGERVKLILCPGNPEMTA